MTCLSPTATDVHVDFIYIGVNIIDIIFCNSNVIFKHRDATASLPNLWPLHVHFHIEICFVFLRLITGMGLASFFPPLYITVLGILLNFFKLITIVTF